MPVAFGGNMNVSQEECAATEAAAHSFVPRRGVFATLGLFCASPGCFAIRSADRGRRPIPFVIHGTPRNGGLAAASVRVKLQRCAIKRGS
jgi:hypothetical protein